MKKSILRNVAIVSAIFIVTFSIMLITNYFQVRGTTPLQTEVVETLKEINDQNANNPALQEQIRQLDLLARKAYFIRMDHLMVGVYILLGMLLVFIICIRLYFAHDKEIPGKEIDPIDEWAIKTEARKYVIWIASGIAAIGLVFVFLSSPYLKATPQAETAEPVEVLADLAEAPTELPETETDTPAEPEIVSEADTTQLVETAVEEAAPQVVVSKVTHNAFRGNNSNGISSAKGVPVKWELGSGTNIAWKQDIPRQGYNSPVINGNNVFFSGADAQARELYCYDLTTGEKRWTLAAANIPGSPSQMPKTTEDTGLAASSVATNGKQVCAIFATGDILCADMEGKQLWAKNLGVPDNHYGYASSLLIFGNLVIVQYDNQNSPKVMALDLATGAERWSKSRTEKVTWSSPIIAYVNNTPQLVLMGNPAITAYNPNNGEQLWRVECMTGEVGSSACSSNGLVFGASEYAKMVAINAADGSLLWEGNDFLPEVASPVATKDNLYLATSYGVVAAYDTQTGELRKEHELNTEFYSSPVIAEGKIYLFSNDGKMHIFSADNDFRLLASFETGERTFATPAFTDGKIVVRTEKSIYCVENK
ncbi:outer membrane protein assembly factor BamB [Parabacteroides sp. PF5-5]|uniref:PQQ-binding-like beta-propeller repeat protein n=1 Tax=unclassified Parabacteroides TaxID=2649774 RepID=UPI00247494A7|nr:MULTISPECIES: PQQ-binding-like beta-propeller repeat protein [unclassified Parabacteroides]MDH6303730.1 outer membrane protein assembly factor BamB [Parabacteroides sp. PH5-39]MDH6314347.1 outer membrane protein assembly factor BamB [Parabacteroides sp. PF5-13]MDH6318588.1 outer membrane protein assembly factor BamB [Parabacteroides sp. PH5-13]MDH6322119.1 outer membrane protein assembly factor BamB [Parabacteroides sp. PH5-8]MDH6325801.1 outer membrane protein assembly factor BamB [Parabac